MKYQVTLFDKQNRYKPISTIVETKDEANLSDKDEKKRLISKGIQKICIKKSWTTWDFRHSGYTVAKARRYER